MRDITTLKAVHTWDQHQHQRLDLRFTQILTFCLWEHGLICREWVKNPFFAFAFCYHCFYYFRNTNTDVDA